MEFVKKGLFGYRLKPANDQIDIDTQVVIPLWSYQKLQADIDRLHTEQRVVSRKAEEMAVREKQKCTALQEQLCEADAAIKLLRAHDKIQRNTICRLSNERDAALAATQNAKKLNENLLRIQRERANSERNIPNKRQHDGYIVLRSEQGRDKQIIHYDYQEWRKQNPFKGREHFKDEEMRDVSVWRSIIQSPLDASIPFDAVQDEIMFALRKDVLPDMGCMCWQDPDHNGEYIETTDSVGNPTCCVYRWSLIANGISCRWEVILYTSLPLKISKNRFPTK